MTLEEFAKPLRTDFDKFAHVVKISGASLD
jgi:hypothetical protein